MKALTKGELSELARLERIIENGLETFLEVGRALLKIREGRLYRESYDAFEAYCREKWGFSKTHANRLIAGAEAVETLGDLEIMPANEAQVRPLTKLEPQQQAEAWEKVAKKAKAEGHPVRARDV